MTTALKRTGAALLTLLMFCMLTLGASAAANTPVGVKFWKENSDKESMANSGIDSDREAPLARQSNGTYIPFSMAICHTINHKSGMDHTTYAHTGAMVNVYANGVGAEKFGGVFDNTEIFHKLADLTKVK